MAAAKERARRRPGRVGRFLYGVPARLWGLGLGRLLGRWFLLLEHRGRRTGRVYRTVIEVVARDEDTGEVFAASGFGRSANWFRNLQADPHATIETAGRRTDVVAHVLDVPERQRIVERYRREHPWRRRVFERMLASDIPFVGFRPRRD